MSLLSLMVITYIAGGIFVILDLYQKQNGDMLVDEQWHIDRPVIYRMKMHLMRMVATLVILFLWPVFLAAEWSAKRRYRMASFINDDHYLK